MRSLRYSTKGVFVCLSFGIVDLIWHTVLWLSERVYQWTTGIIIKRQWKSKSKPEETSPPPPDQTSNEQGNKTQTSLRAPIFALTIGIDDYLHNGPVIKNLSGCVADANDIMAFLSDTLHVPPANMTSLRNDEATAANIIAALESFVNNLRIPKGANIFIFYAGHGSEALPPPGWGSDAKIQTLVPYDFYPGPCDDGKGSSETIQHDAVVARNGISDIKLGQLLENIANEKGNNITVMFDCCHSGSGTRHSNTTGYTFTTRGVDLPEGTRLGADALPCSRGSSVLERDKNKGLASHVFLAACTESQLANERCGRGAFTSALTNLLRSANLEQLTYSDIIKNLPELDGQSPQCEGVNQDRIFLRNYTAGSRRNFYNIVEKATGVYVIDAGEAHGVTIDAEFAVYDTNSCDNELGRLVVDTTTAFQSLLRPVEGAPAFSTPETGAFALQTRTGSAQHVRLCVESDDALAGVFASLEKQTSSFTPSFKVVTTKEEKPDLVITASGGVARFEITDHVCREFGLCEIPYQPATDIESMTNVLRGVGHFYWHLRSTTSAKHAIRPKIVFECYQLVAVDIDDDLLPVMKPMGENLVMDGIIQVGINDSEDKCYGFRINNMSTVPLFVSAFYFNMCDLSIDAYYQPPSAGQQGHIESLPPKGSLTIGYGSSGTPPYTFYLNKGQDVDVGYVKLFLSTEYVDYNSIPQKSPFMYDEARSAEYKPKRRVWDTLSIPIVQRRVGTENLGLSSRVYYSG